VTETGNAIPAEAVPEAMQLELFECHAHAERGARIRPAPVARDVHELASALPERLFLGTSSWSFPTWAGLVYGEEATHRRLARHGLEAYAQHPLLRTVCIDRTRYAALPASEFRRYASQVPEAFRFVIKAYQACTTPPAETRGRWPSEDSTPGDVFLDADYVARSVVEPVLEGLGDRAGVIVFQFPPLPVQFTLDAPRFTDRLHAFLAALPRGPRYAVELRNWKLVTPEYFTVLAETGASHCFSGHPRVSSFAEQFETGGLGTPGLTLFRWNLFPTLGYEEARARYYPFTSIVNRDAPAREAIVRIGRAALGRGDSVFVLVNNKAEGCAPCSVLELAEQFARGRDRGLRDAP